MYEDRNGTDIYYYYDSYGTPVSIRYYEADGTSYRFFLATNQQGDVIGLYNANGTLAVKYEYDAWGNIISTTDADGGSLNSLSQEWSDINPFRYRGYYYDAETGLYYLQSRYYDAEVGRFLNADDATVINATPNALVDKNLFSYCDNNPIVRKDNGGYAWETVFDVVTLGFSIAEVAANPYDVGAWIGLVGDAVDLIPFVTGIGEVTRGLRFVDKLGNTLEIAKAVDFTDDARATINKLDNVNGFTKSNRFDGIDIHKGYKKGDSFSSNHKEYRKVEGIRPDYYDGETIFELKPFNPKAAKQGVKQLKKYSERISDWRIARLEFY